MIDFTKYISTPIHKTQYSPVDTGTKILSMGAVACDLAQLQTSVVLIIRLLLSIADSYINCRWASISMDGRQLPTDSTSSHGNATGRLSGCTIIVYLCWSWFTACSYSYLCSSQPWRFSIQHLEALSLKYVKFYPCTWRSYWGIAILWRWYCMDGRKPLNPSLYIAIVGMHYLYCPCRCELFPVTQQDICPLRNRTTEIHWLCIRIPSWVIVWRSRLLDYIARRRRALIQESGDSSIKHMYHWNVIIKQFPFTYYHKINKCVVLRWLWYWRYECDVCTAMHLACHENFCPTKKLS